MIITKELVDSINSALDKGLVKGLGSPIEGKMCIEALICFKLGLPHSDNPPCVGYEIRQAKIALNDCAWSSPLARAKGMKKLAIAQLGSNIINDTDFVLALKLESTRRILPFLIGKHYDIQKDTKLLEYKTKFENLTQLNDNLWREFYDNYYYKYNYNDYYYYYKYNYYNYNDEFKDEFLLLVADCILSILIKLKSPGCEWI